MKKLGLIIGILLLCVLGYLFVYPHDYQVSFEVKTTPGAVNQTVKSWTKTLENSEIIEECTISEFGQQIKFGDSTHIYQWRIKPIHDSLSKVTVYAKDVNHSLNNKLSVPFRDTDFEKRTRKTLTHFSKKLLEHLKNFKVEVVGEDATTTKFCACTNVRTNQFGKAKGMMRDFPFLSSFIVKNKLQPSGAPFLEVTNWQKKKDSIEFKFCFPIVQMDILPEHPEIEFRSYYGRKALKAIYNGNYITSDRAWYALVDYAERNNIEVTELPLEVFYNNPNMVGNDLNWKAEIFMPLKSSTSE